MSEPPEKSQPETPFSRPERRPLKEAIRSKRQEKIQEEQEAATSQRPMPDKTLLRRRVRNTLHRLLGKEDAAEPQRADPALNIDLELLEDRMRDAIKRAMAGPDPQTGPSEDSAWPAGLDMDLLESQMREILREKTGQLKKEQGSQNLPEGIDMVLLERRVREEIRHLLSGPQNQEEGEDAVPEIDEVLLEKRVRDELARRIPRLRQLGWGAEPEPSQQMPIDMSILEARMNKAVAEVLQAGGPRRGTDLSDEDIDRLIERVISGQ